MNINFFALLVACFTGIQRSSDRKKTALCTAILHCPPFFYEQLDKGDGIPRILCVRPKEERSWISVRTCPWRCNTTAFLSVHSHYSWVCCNASPSEYRIDKRQGMNLFPEPDDHWLDRLGRVCLLLSHSLSTAVKRALGGRVWSFSGRFDSIALRIIKAKIPQKLTVQHSRSAVTIIARMLSIIREVLASL
jgi:hypothetical protein